MNALDYVVVGAAAFAAGGVNALAGGGTLISFPVLIAVGVPPVAANVTNTVALSPGYLGGAISQYADIAAQRHRVNRLVLSAACGGLLGSLLLLLTGDDTFRALTPALILSATLLLAAQDRIRTALRLGPTAEGPATPSSPDLHVDTAWLPVLVAIVSVYGGYFGAGLGIMLLAVLGIALNERLNRLNALKQVLSLVINTTAALFFLTSGKVYWVVAAVMAVSSLAGGSAGGRLAGRVDSARLRTVVVIIGLTVSLVYAVRVWL